MKKTELKQKDIYIPRELEQKIRKYLNKREIVAVVGPRQCGKTTLIKHIFKDLSKAIFLDFEDRKVLALFDNDIESFVELYVKNYDYLFIDEFQYSKEGGTRLKYIFDNNKIKIIISGSSVSEISIQSIKYLVGRIFIFNLYTLSFSEFLYYKDEGLYNIFNKNEEFSPEIINSMNRLYNEFIVYGSYPRVVLSKTKEEKEIVLQNIYNTYLLKEIKEILGLKDDYKISKLIEALSLQIGGLVNYNELCSITNLNYNELLSYINILKKTFIIELSKPFYTNKRVELSKNPRIFFIDNGFRNTSARNFQDINYRSDRGLLNENFVSSELIKKEVELNFWRTKSKAEIDFIVKIGDEVYPIEVKSGLKEMKLGKSLYSFAEKYKTKKVFILSENLDAVKRTDFGKAIFKPLFFISRLF